jgi:hypothetical protein
VLVQVGEHGRIVHKANQVTSECLQKNALQRTNRPRHAGPDWFNRAKRFFIAPPAPQIPMQGTLGNTKTGP